MSLHLRYQLWIAAAAGIIFFTYLGAASLWDEDETLYASCAREMLQRGDWVVPMFNGKLFPDKPPLMFWLMMAGFELFGVNEFGARFFSAVLGVGTALLTYHLGRLLFNPSVGLWAGLITASSIIFTVSARAATVDSALVFVSTLALLCFVAAIRVQGSGFREQKTRFCLAATRRGAGALSLRLGFRVRGSGFRMEGTADSAKPQVRRRRIENSSFIIHHSSFNIHPSSFIPHPFTYSLFILLYLCLGVAILAKGPVGFLLPMFSLGLFLMIVNSRRETTDAQITFSPGACAAAGLSGSAGRISANAASKSVKKWFAIFSVFRPMNF